MWLIVAEQTSWVQPPFRKVIPSAGLDYNTVGTWEHWPPFFNPLNVKDPRCASDELKHIGGTMNCVDDVLKTLQLIQLKSKYVSERKPNSLATRAVTQAKMSKSCLHLIISNTLPILPKGLSLGTTEQSLCIKTLMWNILVLIHQDNVI